MVHFIVDSLWTPASTCRRANRKCYNCGEKNNLANDCPKPDRRGTYDRSFEDQDRQAVTGAIVKGGAIQSIRGREVKLLPHSGVGGLMVEAAGRAAVHAHDSRIKHPTGEFDPAFGNLAGVVSFICLNYLQRWGCERTYSLTNSFIVSDN